MKNKFFVIIFCVLYAPYLWAQHPQISFSDPLTDIKVFQYDVEILDSKIINSSTGYTDLITIAKFGIHVHVFDAQHKQVAYNKLPKNEYYTINELGSSSTICGIYEIAGKINIFLEQFHKKEMCLIRLVIDPVTGQLEKTIPMDALTKFNGPSFVLSSRKLSDRDYYVEKDKFSDDYAVASYDKAREDATIEVFQFNGQHEQVSKAYFYLPQEVSYEYSTVAALQVIKEKGVYLLTNSYNLKGDDKEQVVNSASYISRLTPGGKTFQSIKVDIQPRTREIKAMMEYNPKSDQLELLSQSMENKDYTHVTFSLKKKFWTDLTFINTESLAVINKKRIEMNTLTEYKRKNPGDKSSYNGFPQNMLIADDGTKRTLIFEDIQEDFQRNKGEFMYAKVNYNGIGTLEFDNNITLINSSFADKNIVAGDRDAYFLLNKRAKGYAKCSQGNTLNIGYAGASSFNYVPTGQSRYVVFNDQEGKFGAFTNAMYTNLSTGKAEYLFGKERGQRAIVASGIYDKSKDIYTTLVEEDEGRRLVVRMAWIKFP